jgi:hypothetical protein
LNKKISYLYQFHERIVNGFSAAVKAKYFLLKKMKLLASDLAIAIAAEGAKSVRATG